MKDYLKDREMRTVITDTFSSWSNVTSGVSQESVLASIVFQIYAKYGVTIYRSLFADDAELLKFIKSREDCLELQ